MSDLDDKIRDALRREDAGILDDFGSDPSVFEMMADTFRGRNRRIMALTAFWILLFLVLGVLSAVQFFSAQATRDMLMWALAVIFCVSAVSMMKIMWWMDMNKNAITREVKRLELQIARLAARIKD